MTHLTGELTSLRREMFGNLKNQRVVFILSNEYRYTDILVNVRIDSSTPPYEARSKHKVNNFQYCSEPWGDSNPCPIKNLSYLKSWFVYKTAFRRIVSHEICILTRNGKSENLKRYTRRVSVSI